MTKSYKLELILSCLDPLHPRKTFAGPCIQYIAPILAQSKKFLGTIWANVNNQTLGILGKEREDKNPKNDLIALINSELVILLCSL